MSLAEVADLAMQDGGGPADVLVDDRPGVLEAYARNVFLDFLRTWTAAPTQQETEAEPTQAQPIYVQSVEGMRMDESTTLYVDWAHFLDYNDQVADLIASKFYRLEGSLRQAVSDHVKAVAPEYAQVRACRETAPAIVGGHLNHADCWGMRTAGRERPGQRFFYLFLQPCGRGPAA